MIKIMIGFGIGFAAFYLYQNPGDVVGLMDAAKTGINTTASTIMQATND